MDSETSIYVDMLEDKIPVYEVLITEAPPEEDLSQHEELAHLVFPNGHKKRFVRILNLKDRLAQMGSWMTKGFSCSLPDPLKFNKAKEYKRNLTK